MQGLDPIVNGQLTKDEIKRCELDPTARLEISKSTVPLPKSRQKGARYTPISKRQDRPDAIAWLLRNHPELSDAQISRLIGTTKPTISAVRDKTHRNTPNITPQSPIYLGLCSAPELEKMVIVARSRAETKKIDLGNDANSKSLDDEKKAPISENLIATTSDKLPVDSSPDIDQDPPTASEIFGSKNTDTTPDK
jgi:hypothetical protein